MKEDYLWDKSGSDAEIEGLENVLAVFRYQETSAPQVASVALVETKPFWAWAFSLRLAFGSLAAAAILVSIWFVMSNRRPAVATVSDAEKQISFPAVRQPDTTASTQNIEVIKTSDTPKTNVKLGHTRQFRPKPQKALVAVKRMVDKNEPVKLTNEEKFAYNQLMLALSITGSKLKLVQDTIDRIENTSTSDRQNFK